MSFLNKRFGRDILLESPDIISRDSFGDDVINYSSEVVKGCLVSPASTSDLGDDRSLHDTVSIRVDFPKTFKKSLKDCFVTVDGKRFKVQGDPFPFTASPSPWNRFAICSWVEE